MLSRNGLALVDDVLERFFGEQAGLLERRAGLALQGLDVGDALERDQRFFHGFVDVEMDAVDDEGRVAGGDGLVDQETAVAVYVAEGLGHAEVVNALAGQLRQGDAKHLFRGEIEDGNLLILVHAEDAFAGIVEDIHDPGCCQTFLVVEIDDVLGSHQGTTHVFR